MTTESKKLLTVPYEEEVLGTRTLGFKLADGTSNPWDTLAAIGHDARIAHEQREVIRQAHELVGLILAAAEDQVSINLELGQTHEERERRKVQLIGFIRRNLDQVIDRAEPFMAAAAPFLD